LLRSKLKLRIRLSSLLEHILLMSFFIVLVLNVYAIDVLLAIGDTPLIDFRIELLIISASPLRGSILVDVVDLLYLELVHSEALRHLL